MEHFIRRMEKGDIPHVQQIAKTSWNDAYQGIIPLEIQEKFLALAYSDEMMKKRLEKSNMLVSEVGEKIVGFVDFSPVKENGDVELAAIYIDPPHQSNGLGTALLKEGLTILEGAKRIFVNVEKENLSGTAFYESKGFIVVSEFNDYFDGHILKAVRMVLNL